MKNAKDAAMAALMVFAMAPVLLEVRLYLDPEKLGMRLSM